MKLLTKNTLVLLLVSIFVFLLGGIVFYFQLKGIVDEEATETLYLRKNEIIRYVSDHQQLPNSFSMDESISFSKVHKRNPETVTDEMIYVAAEKELLPYKVLAFDLPFNNENYRCSIRKSLFESDDLIESILRVLSIIIVLLMLVFLLINYLFSKMIWKPFFKILDGIGQYDVKKHQVLQSETSHTIEFVQLGQAIHKMTQKISEDYLNLKSFTENASHEMQTPLAIIKNKAELLMQEKDLNEFHLKQIHDIHQTANRLSKLNQALLLLSKIENGQFYANETIDLKKMLIHKLKDFEELISIKSLFLNQQFTDAKLNMPAELAEIMLSNLILNAIRHTLKGGTISLELTGAYFKISNSAAVPYALTHKIFDRLYKENEDSSSSGLGLALVKKIASVNQHLILYEYLNDKHVFTYFFSTKT